MRNAHVNVKVAILSFAHIHAASYAQILLNAPDVELRVTDPDAVHYGAGEMRGRALADELGAEYVEDYDAIWEWAPDAVIVASENTRHRELVERAAAAGAHVLCEKPLATNETDARAMIEACETAGVVLMTAYPVRFTPEAGRLREIVQAGDLGEILTITGTNNGKIPVGDRAWFTNPDLSGGGALVDHVVHIADLLDMLFDGQNAVSVRAVANRILHADRPHVAAETCSLVSVRYPGNVNAVIDCSWSHPDAAPNWGGLTLEIVGAGGTAEISPFSAHVRGFSGSVSAYLPYGENPDVRMLAEFLDAVRAGHHPQPDGEAGLRSMRVFLAAQDSASRGGQVVMLEPA